jgi:hypothetical protein
MTPGTGAGILVGVLDTGIDATHPEFAGKTIHFAEYESAGTWVGSTARDAGNHGTHVCSLIAGTTYGVGPRADLAVAKPDLSAPGVSVPGAASRRAVLSVAVHGERRGDAAPLCVVGVLADQDRVVAGVDDPFSVRVALPAPQISNPQRELDPRLLPRAHAYALEALELFDRAIAGDGGGLRRRLRGRATL